MNARQEPPKGVPRINCIFDSHIPHAEILDTTTGQAWITVDPISQAEYEALEVPEGFRKVGINKAVMELHYFRRPPHANTDGPLEEREINGVRFVQNANAPSQPPQPIGDGQFPLMILANKYHSLVYREGMTVRVVSNPEGREYIELIAPAPGGGSLFQTGEALSDPDDLGLPAGWSVRDQEITQQTTIHLPCPAEALFCANGASFQGPVDAFIGAA